MRYLCNRGLAARTVISACVTCAVVLAQPTPTYQTDQIGSNSFVSDRSGGVYLVFKKALYRAMTDESDNWDRVTDNIQQAVADPANDNILYAATTQNRIAKSLDKGKTWINLPPLPGAPTPSPWCLYINPANPQEVFVGTSSGLIKSADAGFSWHQTALLGTTFQVVINPRSPEFQFAITADGIFASSDSGNSWKKSETGLPTQVVRTQSRTASTVTVKPSALIPVNGDKFFLLVTTQGKGVFRSDDNGSSWKNNATGLPATETFYTGFAGRDRIVLVSQTSICTSTDATHWQTLPIKSIHGGIIISGFMKHPKRDGLLLQFNFVTDDVVNVARLGYLDPNGILIGLNYGVVPHSDVETVLAGVVNGHPALFAITANLNFTDQVQQWTRPIFLSMSLNDGYSWELMSNYPKCGTKASAELGTMWLYGSGCVLQSDDGGASWNVPAGLNFGSTNAEVTKIELDPKQRNVLYYSRGVNERGVYRYQYDPGTKQGQSVDLKVMGSDVIVADDNNKMLFTGAGQLSTDGGWTWTDKSASLVKLLPNIRSGYAQPLTFLSFHGSELRILIATFDNMSRNAAITVLKSGDLGTTWQAIASLPRQMLVGVFRNPRDTSNVLISTVLFTKGQFADSPAMAKVLESKNGGETWNDIYSLTPPPSELKSSSNYTGNVTAASVRAVAQVPLDRGRYLLVGGSKGLWKSDDEGRTWKRLGGVQ